MLLYASVFFDWNSLHSFQRWSFACEFRSLNKQIKKSIAQIQNVVRYTEKKNTGWYHATSRESRKQRQKRVAYRSRYKAVGLSGVAAPNSQGTPDPATDLFPLSGLFARLPTQCFLVRILEQRQTHFKWTYYIMSLANQCFVLATGWLGGLLHRRWWSHRPGQNPKGWTRNSRLQKLILNSFFNIIS